MKKQLIGLEKVVNSIKSNKKAVIITTLVIVGVFAAVFTFTSKAAITSVFIDNFSSTYHIDRDLTSAKVGGERIRLPDTFVSARVVSTRVRTSSYNITKAKIEVDEKRTEGSSVIYFLSNDNGRTWEKVTPGFFYNFRTDDGRLKWMATIARELNGESPVIYKITITYKEDSDLLKKSQDSRRRNDLSVIASGLKRFYDDYNQYPHVGGSTAYERWNNLRILLNRKSQFSNSYYVRTWPEDPMHEDEDIPRTYDYQDLRSSQNYVLAAKFENTNNSILDSDIDGMFGDINCNDPYYCRGDIEFRSISNGDISSVNSQAQSGSNGSTINSTNYTGQAARETSSRTVSRSSSRAIYGSGPEALVANVLAGIYGTGSETVITQRTQTGTTAGSQINGSNNINQLQSGSMSQGITNGSLGSYIRSGILIRLSGDSEVYEVIKGQKHWIPNAAVFEDYGFETKNVKVVSRSEFNRYPRANLLRVLGDSRIYYLTEQGRIRLIPNVEIFMSYGNSIDDVVDISIAEFNSYPKVSYIFLETREDDRIWFLEGNTKHPVKFDALIRLNVSWKDIAPVNRTEFDYYKDGQEIK